MKKNITIGVFDSGVGGLSVLRSLKEALPGARYLYYADTAHVPYGKKTLDEVKEYALNIARFLLYRGADAIVIACNTSTAAALEDIKRLADPIPVFGMFEGAIYSVINNKARSPIGICATKATTLSGAYIDAFRNAGFEKTYGCYSEHFVDLVESGKVSGVEVYEEVKTSLKPLKEKGINTFIFGCTHYPFVKEEISRYLGNQVQLIDPGKGVAEKVKEYFKDIETNHYSLVCYTSGDVESFKRVGSYFLGEEILYAYNPKKTLMLATSNQGKVNELKEMLSDTEDKITILSNKDFPADFEVEETGTTFSENAKIKAEYAFKLTGFNILADDSGLCVDALEGGPGVYSARYAGPGCTPRECNEKLLKVMEKIENRKAQFVADVVFINDKGEIKESRGIMEGTIGRTYAGQNGFGYDPLFIVDGLNLTSAEISQEEKNELSHRGKAFKKLKPEILKHFALDKQGVK